MNVKFEDKITGTIKGKYLKEEKLFEVSLPSKGTVKLADSGYYDLVDEIGTFAKSQTSKIALGHTDEGHYDDPAWKWAHSVIAIAEGKYPSYYVVEHEEISPMV